MLHGWWFPPGISHHAFAHDAQFARTLTATVFIFFAAQFALAAIVLRFRVRPIKKVITRRNTTIWFELSCAAATAVLFIGLLAAGGRSWAAVQFTAAPPDAQIVEVLARQFAWSFRYAGPDGRFGRTDIKLVNDSAGNPFGLDDADPAAADDVVSATLRIPAGRPVLLKMNARDVVHSFFIRELRLKQDIVPGMQIPLHFQADVPGSYEIPCAELCGLGHHQMRTTVTVMPAGEFDEWKKGQTR